MKKTQRRHFGFFFNDEGVEEHLTKNWLEKIQSLVFTQRINVQNFLDAKKFLMSQKSWGLNFPEEIYG